MSITGYGAGHLMAGVLQAVFRAIDREGLHLFDAQNESWVNGT